MKYLWPISIVTIISSLIHRSWSIDCYSCDSSSDFSCSEFWDPSLDVNQQYYSDCGTVHDAKYCVKMAGVFDGKLGTKVWKWHNLSFTNMTYDIIFSTKARDGWYVTVLIQTSLKVTHKIGHCWWTLWQYGLWSFQTGGTKLERFLTKNESIEFWELE